MKYVPLFIKTDNSLQQSLIRIDKLINKAKEYNFTSLTITDNNMYGVMDFYKLCKKNDIKPIVGLEICYNNNIIVLYCINYDGYKNLIKLSTIMSYRNIELADLEKYSDNIICIVPFNSISVFNDIRGFYKYIFKSYKNMDEYNNLSGDLIYMNETLYIDKSDNKYIKYWDAIKDGTTIDKVSNDKLNNYLMTYEEVKAKYNLDNNEFIYDICNLEIPFNQTLMPVFDNPDGVDSYTYLKRKCIEGLKNKFGNSISQKYQERLKYELDVINKMGFCDYFLIVYDYIKYAKDNNIIVGPGRGSAVGSLVAYTLNITDIDPLKYNLIFERFLNLERISMPDIDVDFEHNKREEMIKYCISRYGEKSVAPIITFGTMGSKQAIRDIGRSMDIDLSIVDGLCRLIDPKLSLKDNYKNNKVKNYIERYDNLDKLYKIANKFEGLKRHTSIHAAGVVMSRYPLDEIIPLDRTHSNYYVSGYDMKYLEEIGLLKMDFLAIKYLTIIHDMIDDINNKYNINISFDTIPFNDPKALNIFTKADTLGIFQFESDGMISFLKQLKPNTFDDICAAVALYRPGPMQNIPTYINRKNNNQRIDYLHDSLIPILKPTYGIMIYQEQIMQIAQLMADYTLGEADILRKAMSKKKRDLLLQEEKRFKERSLKKGYKEEVIDRVYSSMIKFAEYGFNKSHSVGYSLVSYRMAYLKAYYPKEFVSNLLSIEMNDTSKCKKYIYECKKNNINILKPDINYSSNKYIPEKNGIRYPLTSIKNVGINASTVIINERNNNGKFKNIYDFVKRCYSTQVNRRVLESLIYSGAFNDFGYNRNTLINNLDAIINYGELINDLSEEYALKPEIIIYDEYSDKYIMERELELFGFYLSNHPVTTIKSRYNNIVELSDIEKYFDKNINIVCLVDRIKEVNTKTGDKMAFITGSDELTSIDITIFPKIYKKYNNISNGDILYINGKIEKRYDKYQLICNNIEIIDK